MSCFSNLKLSQLGMATVFTGLCMLQGCVAVEDEDSNIAVSYSVLHSGTDPVNTDESKLIMVIKNQYDYVNQLAYYSTDDAVDVDFDDYQVVVIDLGERDSSAYSITINSTSESEYAVTLSYTLNVPGSDCSSSTSTNPYAILSINTTKEIVIEESLSATSCTSS